MVKVIILLIIYVIYKDIKSVTLTKKNNRPVGRQSSYKKNITLFG